MSKLIEVSVRALAAGGSGVADLPDGRVVFVPRTAPGDVARIRVLKEKSRWAVGSLVELLEPGRDRVTPPCPLYARCGGCQLQHIGYETQLEWKARFVADALDRIGGVGGVPSPEVSESPGQLHYRSRVTFTMRRLRGGRVVAGLHELERPSRVLDVTGSCLLADRRLIEAWAALRRGWGDGARLLPGAGRLKLELRLATDGVHLVVHGGRRGWDATPLLDATGSLTVVWHQPGNATADSEEPTPFRRSGVARPPTATAPGHARSEAGSQDLVDSPAFEQVNEGAAALLRAHVLEVCERVRPSSTGRPAAIDAYAGSGVYGLALGAAGWRVVAIESQAAAARVAAARAAAAGAPAEVRVVRGRVEEELHAHLPTDLLVVNPPRSGLHPDVPTAVLGAPPAAIVYVSCDPGTLARDVRALAPTYEVTGLRCFDLFPQTAHVESVAVLEKRAGP